MIRWTLPKGLSRGGNSRRSNEPLPLPTSAHGSELPGWRRHPFLQMLDEGFDEGREVSAARIDHLDRRCRRVPVRKYALQPACTEILHGQHRGKNSDAQTGGRHRMKYLHVAHDHAREQGDFHRNVTLFEAQVEGVAPGAKEQAIVLLQVLG